MRSAVDLILLVLSFWFESILSSQELRMSTVGKVPTILGRHATTPKAGLSVFSHNVLMPNSLDGWWVYKTYSPRHKLDESISSWENRQSLIRAEIVRADADVVCLQEVCVGSFESDFSFMHELGYDRNEMFKRGRFRPATFWRSSRVTQYGQTLHRDRCLVTAFHPTPTSSAPSESTSISTQEETCFIKHADGGVYARDVIWLANCHLTAGSGFYQNVRRLRQMHDCTEAIKKEQSKYITIVSSALQQLIGITNRAGSKAKRSGKGSLESQTAVMLSTSAVGDPIVGPLSLPISLPATVVAPAPPPLPIDLSLGTVIIGDLNVDGKLERSLHGKQSSCVDEILTVGVVGTDFLEDGRQVASKPKINKIGRLIDAYEYAYTVNCAEALSNGSGRCSSSSSCSPMPPPTMVCEELYGVLTQEQQKGEKEEEGEKKSVSVSVSEKSELSFPETSIKSNNVAAYTTAATAAIEAAPAIPAVELKSGERGGGGGTAADGDNDNNDGEENGHELSPLGIELVNKVFDSFATTEIPISRLLLLDDALYSTDTTTGTTGGSIPTTGTAATTGTGGSIDAGPNPNQSIDTEREPVVRVMNIADVTRWLNKINLVLGRGSEFRAAVVAMELSSPTCREHALAVHREEERMQRQLHDNIGDSVPLSTTALTSAANSSEQQQQSNAAATAATTNDITAETDTTTAATNAIAATSATTVKAPTVLPEDGYLTREAFISIYQTEVALGKVWGVAHDLWSCGYPLPDSNKLFTGRFDRCYIHSALYNIYTPPQTALTVGNNNSNNNNNDRNDVSTDTPAVTGTGTGNTNIMRPDKRVGVAAKTKTKGMSPQDIQGVSQNLLLAVRDTGGRVMSTPIPNANYPSDHLPIMAVIAWR